MIKGFKVTEEIKNVILSQIELSQTSKGLPHYWTPGAVELEDGFWLIPFTEQMLDTVLRDGKKPLDFPEGQQLVESLGGLDARVEVSQDEFKITE